jgi:lipopolysaccharide biosynthesis glycosyltransferase
MATDEPYAMSLATALRSMAEANRSGRPVDVHILSQGLSPHTRMKISESLPTGSASITWLDIDLTPFRAFSTSAYITQMTYARLLIPHALPAGVSRVLYLDTDILVLGDLMPLLETDLQGAVVGAVLDGLDRQIKDRKPAVEKVPRVKNYFNAGILLIDLDKWREEGISRKALKYLAGHPESPFSDQDALNVVCDGRWKQLDQRWNYQDHHHNRVESMLPDQQPAIVHFVTSAKPWIAGSLSVNASLYDRFRAETCFARTSSDKLVDLAKRACSRLNRIAKTPVFGQQS